MIFVITQPFFLPHLRRLSCLPLEGKVAPQVTDEVKTEINIAYLIPNT